RSVICIFFLVNNLIIIVKNQKYHLSDRECEILQLAGDGNNTKTISETLFISEHTVNTHRKNILRKMEAKNITEGFRKAVSHGLI
ncbi:MAG: helix-turn-helix transcriptional regulator, partial [Cytophagales bacterium]|nr:helix-turn-helix transcriptional regulator [Cytophaga sp.]